MSAAAASTMQALRFHGREDIRLDEVPEPTPGPGQVKIRVECAGVCGTDVSEYFGGPQFTSDRPHPLTGHVLPSILGHEFAGSVTEVGAGVTRVAPGDLVAVQPTLTCGVCSRCRHGYRHLCRTIAFHGYHTDGGGMAEFTVVGEDAVHVLPAGTTPLLGALVEPLAVARRAARQTGVEGFGTVAVHGAGAIGLGALLTFRAVGVTVIVSDPSPIRRRTAEELGAAATVDPTEQDVARELRAATDGLGVDASLDAAGVAPALAAAARSTRPGGTVVLVAHHHAPLPLKSISFIGNELTVRGSAIYDDADFAWVLERIASDLAPMRQIPTEMSMSKFLVDGLQELRNGSINKAVLRINGDFDGEV